MNLGQETSARFWQLDALRLAGVLAVVVQHAAVAYSAYVPWWYVRDPAKSALADFLLLVCDGATMPLLFAVAGYFALPSLDRRGLAGFLAGRARRLVVPLVGLTLFFCPIIAYIDYLDKGGRDGFFAHWLAIVPTALDWRFMLFAGADAAKVSQTLLWSFHLWFLAMLFVFCLVVAGARLAVGPGLTHRGRLGAWGLGRIGLLALGIGLAAGAGQLACPDPAWARLGPFLVFQPTRLPLYAGFFLLGAYAWKRGWSAGQSLPGRPWVWGLAFLLTLAAMARTGGGALQAWASGAPSVPLSLAYGLARTAFALAATILAVALVGRVRAGSFWRRPGLSRTSFDLYLYHFPPVVVLQYWLCGTAVPVVAKIAVCCALPILVCLGATRLCGRRAWTRPALVGLAFVGCAVFWG